MPVLGPPPAKTIASSQKCGVQGKSLEPQEDALKEGTILSRLCQPTCGHFTEHPPILHCVMDTYVFLEKVLPSHSPNNPHGPHPLSLLHHLEEDFSASCPRIVS